MRLWYVSSVRRTGMVCGAHRSAACLLWLTVAIMRSLDGNVLFDGVFVCASDWHTTTTTKHDKYHLTDVAHTAWHWTHTTCTQHAIHPGKRTMNFVMRLVYARLQTAQHGVYDDADIQRAQNHNNNIQKKKKCVHRTWKCYSVYIFSCCCDAVAEYMKHSLIALIRCCNASMLRCGWCYLPALILCPMHRQICATHIKLLLLLMLLLPFCNGIQFWVIRVCRNMKKQSTYSSFWSYLSI